MDCNGGWRETERMRGDRRDRWRGEDLCGSNKIEVRETRQINGPYTKGTFQCNTLSGTTVSVEESLRSGRDLWVRFIDWRKGGSSRSEVV